MAKVDYKICNRCVMDTTAEEIEFDSGGLCNFCRGFESNIKKRWFPNDEGKDKLKEIVSEIKKVGKGKKYDSIIGLSGGVDSSYLALIAKKELGLNPLAVHVDAGWNSEIAVQNIENIVRKLDIDLFTYVVDWQEVRDLQRAYLRSGLANQDVPQDHAFFAMLYRYAVENKIKYVLTGSNIATESILPKSWGYYAMDVIQLKEIHKKYGEQPLRSYPTLNLFQYYIYYPLVKKMKVVAPLNYLPYNREDAMKVLQEDLGYKSYGQKHHESVFTKFFQSYYLPIRFGFDKRKAHLSSLILSGQITREEALKELKKEPYNKENILEDQIYVLKKLGISAEEFEQILNSPIKTYQDYKSFESTVFYKLVKPIYHQLKKKN
ncbi:MAG: N-acetyl sugar amidotransferase [Bacillota bacterium]